jgi:UDP-sugar transporter A1/2/3
MFDFKLQMSLRNMILIAICLQNAFYTLLRKYSVQSENVSSKEILLLSEIIKITVSSFAIVASSETTNDGHGSGVNRIIWLILNSGKMFVLAAIYLTMNVLSFVALLYIGAGEFTICAQLKVLTTASFSCMILNTSLSWTKWRALFLLVLGCTLVASPSLSNLGSDKFDISTYWKMIGFGAVMTEVILSGFASIYYEKIVKNTTENVTIWERNFQLSFYSIIIYLFIIIFELNHTGADERQLGENWSMLTMLVALLSAGGGLLVAATLKYADSILKTLATAGAIVLSTVLGHFYLSGPMDFNMIIGGLVAIISILDYTLDATSTK